MLCKRRYSGVARLIILDHIDRLLQSLLVNGGWEWWRVVEPNEDAYVQKLILRHTQIANDVPLGNVRE